MTPSRRIFEEGVPGTGKPSTERTKPSPAKDVPAVFPDRLEQHGEEDEEKSARTVQGMSTLLSVSVRTRGAV